MAFIELRDIDMIYPNGVVANDGVTFSTERGEIHALVGENGAGKTTLMKILYGMEMPTRGQVWVDGHAVNFHSSHDAIAHRIGMVHQNFMLIPSFTVADNIVLGAEITHNMLLDRKAAIQRTEELSQQYGLWMDPQATIDSINVGMRQRVEILKILYRGADVLILDEPTAVLTPQETQELFQAIRTLVSQGKTVIFITHKLREVQEIADRVTVMRAGRVMGTLPVVQTTRETLARMMVGRDVFLNVEKPPLHRGEKVLEVIDLSFVSDTGRAMLQNVSFNVYAGEILGIAGVEGNGQTELVEVITGLRQAAGGHVRMLGDDILNQSPRAIRQAGLAHIPEDRLTNGLALNATLEENLIVDRYTQPAYSNGISLNQRKITAMGNSLIAQYDIRTPSADMPVRSLSGGNMQKVIVAREFSARPRLLVAAQPTRGVDVGATEFIRQQLVQQRSQGTAILLISADLAEVMSISDRIAVMYEGQITGIFSQSLQDASQSLQDASRAEQVSEEELGLFMLGLRHHEEAELEANR
jgi:ABC-type uncharacterized transport system ATPase subunit